MVRNARSQLSRAGGGFAGRAATLDAAFLDNPKRFKGIAPHPPRLPVAAWINPPKKEPEDKKTPHHSTLN